MVRARAQKLVPLILRACVCVDHDNDAYAMFEGSLYAYHLLYLSLIMPKLEDNEEKHLRSLTLDFKPDEMATLYKDVHKKGFIELVALAWEIKERREKEQGRAEVGSRDEAVSMGNVRDGEAPVARTLDKVVNEKSGGRVEAVVDRKPDLTPIIDLTSDNDQEAPQVPTILPAKRGRGSISHAEKKESGVWRDRRFMDSQARLARVKIWIDAYEWTENTTKRNVIDSLMKLESERISDSSTFGTGDALRSFLTSRGDILSKHNPRFAKHFLADRSGPCGPFRTTARSKNTHRGSEQAPDIDDDDSGSDGKSEESGLSDISSQSEYERIEPVLRNKKRQRVQRRNGAVLPEPLDHGELSPLDLYKTRALAATLVRAQRLFDYSEKYGAGQATGKQLFYTWVVKQEGQATADGSIQDMSAFGTGGSVDRFIERNSRVIINAPGGDKFLKFLDEMKFKGKASRPMPDAEAGRSKNH